MTRARLNFAFAISICVVIFSALASATDAESSGAACARKYSFMQLLKARSGFLAFGKFGRENALTGETDLGKNFADPMAKKFDTPIFTYHDYQWTGLVTSRSNGFAIENVKAAIDEMLKRMPGEKIILFNLDGVDIARAMKAELSGAPIEGFDGTNFTGAELKLILSNPVYFKATRWYRNGVELTSEQIEELTNYKQVEPKP